VNRSTHKTVLFNSCKIDDRNNVNRLGRSTHDGEPKPPPPPPPPRNRQELLEQRQQELVEKQRQLQSQFHKLQELRTNGNGGAGSPQSYGPVYANFRR
jgi:hypothetical protein